MSPTHTPATKTLVGSFEESILQGRMSTADAYSIPGFTAELAVSGEGKQLPHVSIPFSPVFYSLPGEDAPTPYVANIELAHRDDPGRHPALLKVPVRGMVQLAIFNPQQTGVRVFLVRYDHSEMPPRTKTFVRQRTIDETFSNGAIRYLAHLRFVCLKKSVYLHGGIRVVFAHRTLDSAEGLSVITDGPSNPRYIPLTHGMLHRGRSGSVDDDDALKCAPTTQVAFSL
ncbi:hypothetical protein CAOG_03435 [Capsaspora owczarzaki ATCC 30864]|uniref:hypothetical protein n=1 Tax=Capsaspora owczarzaki (strain ATCC 30864) TaxID=595528 RepID=UPI0001FE5911|nr:hypothetical protein CAOG_03435 [Capsaspora owczarzaki ATCC 30864]|eukprot:XP_004364274.1 hypothetical protein CAOG_03435 [Capsaspora owczarzaki ATCC 30864]